MPTTVNGIGTHYYGKKQVSIRTGVCQSCRRVGNLASYETRLWFVIVFIPVIPLGRKRVIDECPSCRRHRVADADAFEQAKQLQISAGLDEFRRAPSTDAALGAHARLLAFHEMGQAAEFRRSALERFPEHAGLRVGLAGQLEQVSDYATASALYQEALDLDPELPGARVGVARQAMARGELDAARDLLDFLGAPGAADEHDLGPLDVLSGYYQRAGRHPEALELAAHLLRELPDAGRQHAFRAFVRRSERAVRAAESILPPRAHSLRGLLRSEGSEYPAWLRRTAIAGLLAGLFAVGMAANNEYIRRHRTLHVLNAIGAPIEVSVDGAPAAKVTGHGTIRLSEGHHQVRLSGPVAETHEIDLHAGYFDRWYLKPVWVLNPGLEAVLEHDTVVYARNPRPGHRELLVGSQFVALPHADYAFEDPPKEISMKEGAGEVVKTAVRWTRDNDTAAYLMMLGTDRPAGLTFAERRLRRGPVQDELLKYYGATARPDEYPRLEAFLKSGLNRRPLWIEWHRAYQFFAATQGHDAELVPCYDRLLAADPRSGGLVYLRARLEPDPKRGEAMFVRARELAPKLPWPHLALGRGLEAEGRWDESYQAYQKARECGADADYLDEDVHIVRLALGQAKAMADEYRQRLGIMTNDLRLLGFLLDALAVSGQADEVEPALDGWFSRTEIAPGSEPADLARASGLYQAGKLAECADYCSRSGSLAGSTLRARTLLALGRTAEVVAEPAFASLWDEPWNAAALGLALELEGRSSEARPWRLRAARELERRGASNRRVAVVLAADRPVSQDELASLVVDPPEKALLCATLAARFPAQRAEYLAQARRFNLRRTDPYHLVRRATDPVSVPAPAANPAQP